MKRLKEMIINNFDVIIIGGLIIFSAITIILEKLLLRILN